MTAAAAAAAWLAHPPRVFPADNSVEKPDYELGMHLLDNGVSRDMLIDYGE